MTATHHVEAFPPPSSNLLQLDLGISPPTPSLSQKRRALSLTTPTLVIQPQGAEYQTPPHRYRVDVPYPFCSRPPSATRSPSWTSSGSSGHDREMHSSSSDSGHASASAPYQLSGIPYTQHVVTFSSPADDVAHVTPLVSPLPFAAGPSTSTSPRSADDSSRKPDRLVGLSAVQKEYLDEVERMRRSQQRPVDEAPTPTGGVATYFCWPSPDDVRPSSASTRRVSREGSDAASLYGSSRDRTVSLGETSKRSSYLPDASLRRSSVHQVIKTWDGPVQDAVDQSPRSLHQTIEAAARLSIEPAIKTPTSASASASSSPIIKGSPSRILKGKASLAMLTSRKSPQPAQSLSRSALTPAADGPKPVWSDDTDTTACPRLNAHGWSSAGAPPSVYGSCGSSLMLQNTTSPPISPFASMMSTSAVYAPFGFDADAEEPQEVISEGGTETSASPSTVSGDDLNGGLPRAVASRPLTSTRPMGSMQRRDRLARKASEDSDLRSAMANGSSSRPTARARAPSRASSVRSSMVSEDNVDLTSKDSLDLSLSSSAHGTGGQRPNSEVIEDANGLADDLEDPIAFLRGQTATSFEGQRPRYDAEASRDGPSESPGPPIRANTQTTEAPSQAATSQSHPRMGSPTAWLRHVKGKASTASTDSSHRGRGQDGAGSRSPTAVLQRLSRHYRQTSGEDGDWQFVRQMRTSRDGPDGRTLARSNSIAQSARAHSPEVQRPSLSEHRAATHPPDGSRNGLDPRGGANITALFRKAKMVHSKLYHHHRGEDPRFPSSEATSAPQTSAYPARPTTTPPQMKEPPGTRTHADAKLEEAERIRTSTSDGQRNARPTRSISIRTGRPRSTTSPDGAVVDSGRGAVIPNDGIPRRSSSVAAVDIQRRNPASLSSDSLASTLSSSLPLPQYLPGHPNYIARKSTDRPSTTTNTSKHKPKPRRSFDIRKQRPPAATPEEQAAQAQAYAQALASAQAQATERARQVREMLFRSMALPAPRTVSPMSMPRSMQLVDEPQVIEASSKKADEGKSAASRALSRQSSYSSNRNASRENLAVMVPRASLAGRQASSRAPSRERSHDVDRGRAQSLDVRSGDARKTESTNEAAELRERLVNGDFRAEQRKEEAVSDLLHRVQDLRASSPPVEIRQLEEHGYRHIHIPQLPQERSSPRRSNDSEISRPGSRLAMSFGGLGNKSHPPPTSSNKLGSLRALDLNRAAARREELSRVRAANLASGPRSATSDTGNHTFGHLIAAHGAKPNGGGVALAPAVLPGTGSGKGSTSAPPEALPAPRPATGVSSSDYGERRPSRPSTSAQNPPSSRKFARSGGEASGGEGGSHAQTQTHKLVKTRSAGQAGEQHVGSSGHGQAHKHGGESMAATMTRRMRKWF